MVNKNSEELCNRAEQYEQYSKTTIVVNIMVYAFAAFILSFNLIGLKFTLQAFVVLLGSVIGYFAGIVQSLEYQSKAKELKLIADIAEKLLQNQQEQTPESAPASNKKNNRKKSSVKPVQ